MTWLAETRASFARQSWKRESSKCLEMKQVHFGLATQLCFQVGLSSLRPLPYNSMRNTTWISTLGSEMESHTWAGRTGRGKTQDSLSFTEMNDMSFFCLHFFQIYETHPRKWQKLIEGFKSILTFDFWCSEFLGRKTLQEVLSIQRGRSWWEGG